MFKILYLEDDINLSNTIVEFLEDSNFNVAVSYNSKDALDKLYNTSFDLLILDVNLPDISGFELLKILREADIFIPAIFTTTLNDMDSLDTAYNIGVDDYIRKPFVLKELLHRVNAILKRSFNTQNTTINISDNITFNLNNNILKKDNIIIKINQKEITLLRLLIKHKNNIVMLNTIYEEVWSSSQSYSEASLRTYIKNLRKILDKDKIISIKKQGYQLVV